MKDTKMKNILTNEINGKYLMTYTNKTITQDTFDSFLRVKNGKVILKDVGFIECNLTELNFNIVTNLENVVIVGCSTNETIASLLAIKELL